MSVFSAKMCFIYIFNLKKILKLCLEVNSWLDEYIIYNKRAADGITGSFDQSVQLSIKILRLSQYIIAISLNITILKFNKTAKYTLFCKRKIAELIYLEDEVFLVLVRIPVCIQQFDSSAHHHKFYCKHQRDPAAT